MIVRLLQGNIDTKHVGVGSTLYLPVEVSGALFCVGVSLPFLALLQWHNDAYRTATPHKATEVSRYTTMEVPLNERCHQRGLW